MLGGLSRALRKVGIDAISLTSNDNIDHYIQVAQRENRYFLTRGNVYVRVNGTGHCQLVTVTRAQWFDFRFSILQCSKFLPPGHCYSVTSDFRDQQLHEVLNYFNLTVSEANVFSRCLRCNGSEFLFVSQIEMSEMTRIPLATHVPHSHDSYLNDQKARSWTLRTCDCIQHIYTQRPHFHWFFVCCCRKIVQLLQTKTDNVEWHTDSISCYHKRHSQHLSIVLCLRGNEESFVVSLLFSLTIRFVRYVYRVAANVIGTDRISTMRWNTIHLESNRTTLPLCYTFENEW